MEEKILKRIEALEAEQERVSRWLAHASGFIERILRTLRYDVEYKKDRM